MKDQQIPVTTVDDLFITRDDEGDVVPIEFVSVLLGTTLILRPMTYGYMKRKGHKMNISAVEWETEEKLQCAKDHYVAPDLTGLTIKDVEDRMGPMTLNHLVSMVVAHSVPTIGQQRAAMLANAIKNVLSDKNTPRSNMSSMPTEDINTPEGEISTS